MSKRPPAVRAASSPTPNLAGSQTHCKLLLILTSYKLRITSLTLIFMSQKAIWTTIVIVILIIIGIWWGITANNGEDVEPVDDNGTTTNQLRVEDNAIVALDQRPGDEITVPAATLEEGGFVVIHNVNEGGAPGDIIGASDYLSAGDHSNVVIELDAAVEDETELIAMLHSDDGDRVFNAEDDDPILSTLGGPIMMSFMIDSAAGENFDVKL